MKNPITATFKMILTGGFLLASVFIPAQNANEDLVKACMKGDLSTVKSLVEGGADVNYKTAAGATPVSVSYFWPEQTQYLLDKGADVNSGEFPALVNASKYYSKDVVAILLNAGADPNKPAVIDVTAPLKKMVADEKAKGKDANKIVIKALEDQIAKRGSDPVTVYPLQEAVSKSNCTAIIRMLIEAGAKTDIVNNVTGGNLLNEMAANYETAAQRAADRAFNQPYWDKAGIGTPDWYRNLDFSTQGTAEEIVALLVSKNVDISQTNLVGTSALYTAFWRDTLVNDELVLSLINHGANLEGDPGKSRIESPAIIWAAAHCNTDVIDALLKRGANINAEDRLYDPNLKTYVKGFTPLINAVRYNNMPVVKLLVERGAKTSNGVSGYTVLSSQHCLTKVENKSAIYFAIENGNMEMVKYLAETAHVWSSGSERLVIDPVEQTETKDFGTFALVTTKCIGYDSYTPAQYAKALGLDAMYEYLKAQHLDKK